MRYERKPEFVEVVQFNLKEWERDLFAYKMVQPIPEGYKDYILPKVYTREGFVQLEDGDFIITHSDGDEVMSKDEFESKYQKSETLEEAIDGITMGDY